MSTFTLLQFIEKLDMPTCQIMLQFLTFGTNPAILTLHVLPFLLTQSIRNFSIALIDGEELDFGSVRSIIVQEPSQNVG